MANSKISDLPAGAPAQSGDLIPIARGGANFNLLAGQIAGLASAINVSLGGNTAGALALVSSGTLFLAGGNNVTLSQNGQSVTISANTAAAANLSVSAGTTSGAFGGVTFPNANGVSFGLNNGTITASVAAQSVQTQASGNLAATGFATTTIAGSQIAGTLNTAGMTLAVPAYLTTGAGANFSGGVSTLGNTSGNTGITGTQLVLAGGNNITLSQATGANGATVTVSAFNQTNQTMGIYASSQTTGQSSSSTIDARSLTVVGAGNVSAGMSAGSLVISGATAAGLTTGGIYAAGNTTGQSSSSTYPQTSFNISFAGLVSGGWSSNSLLISAPQTTGLTQSLYATSNTTQSSSGTTSIGSLLFAGAGMASVGVTNGSVVISAPNTTSFSATGNASVSLNANTLSIGANAAALSIGGNSTSAGAGYSNISTGTVLLAGGNNITLSQNGASITISGANAGGAQTGISGIQVSNTTYTSGTVTWQNANGISFGSSGANGVSASYTVPSTAGLLSAVNLSAGTTSGNLSAVTFSNSNGVSFGLNASTITGSVAAQTNQTVGLYALGNTTQNSSSTMDARTLSFNGLGAQTVGFSNGSIQLSVPATSSLSATGAVSISVNGATISIGAPLVPQLSFFNVMSGDVTTLTQIGNGSVQVYPINGAVGFSASRADMLAFNTVSSSSNSSHAGVISAYMGLYTLTGSTLSLASSGSQSHQWTNTSNNSMGSVSGQRRLSVPINVNYTGGDIWMAVMSQTSSTNANWFTASNLVIQPQLTGQLFGLIGEASANSKQIQPGYGLFSVTSAAMPVSMALSAISGAGSAGTGANVYMAPVQFCNMTA
jgi:hypothetical protein